MKPMDAAGGHGSCKPWIPDAAATAASSDLSEFMATCSQFDSNLQAAKMAMGSLEAVRATMLRLTEITQLTVNQLLHLEAAVFEVAESRRTIAWTFVWQREHGKAAAATAELFKHNQETLSTRLDVLQSLVEGSGGESSVSARIASVPDGYVTAAMMDELVRDGMRIRDLITAVHEFREPVVKDVQIFSAMHESEGAAAAAAKASTAAAASSSSSASKTSRQSAAGSRGKR